MKCLYMGWLYMKVAIRNVGPINSAELVLDRPTVLVGPNWSGKSVIMHTLYAVLAMANGQNATLPDAGEVVIETERGRARIFMNGDGGIVDLFFSGRVDRVERVRVGRQVSGVTELLRLFPSVPIVLHFCRDAKRTFVPAEPASDAGFATTLLELIESDVEFQERVESVACSLMPCSRIRYAHGMLHLKWRGRWLNIDEVPISARRIIERVAALEFAEMMHERGKFAVSLVEDFDASQHALNAVFLIGYVSRLRHLAIVETRMPITIRAALTNGMNVYYVADGKATKIESEEQLRDHGLFKAEAEAFALASGVG